MALSDSELQDILERLSPDEQKQLYSQLGLQFRKNKKRSSPKSEQQSQPKTQSKPTKPQPPIGYTSRIYCCIHCGSINIKGHGKTSSGTQRFFCKDCKKTFTENYGSVVKNSHLDKETWTIILTGIVYNHSIPVIAKDANKAKGTVWLCRQKLCKAIADYYGYSDLFRGNSQADEYYLRACFKGKRDAEFFIYTLCRMPRHHRNLQQKIDYLMKNGIYDRLLREDPDYLESLLYGEEIMKRGISNEQICVLTLIDENNDLYLEPVSVGRLEKAMAKIKLKPRFNKENKATMVTDDHNAYNRVLYGTGVKHEVVPASQHATKKYNLAKVNSIHSALSAYMDKKHGRVYTTKYLDLNLMLFWWLFKHKELSTAEKVDKLYKIITDDIDNQFIKDRVNHTGREELRNREITIDTKGQFPTKI